MLAVRDRLADFGPDTSVALVTFSSGARLADYVDHHALPFPVLTDPDRSTYHAFGLERGTRRRVWGWRSARAYFEIIRRDGFGGLRLPEEDPLQLGGDFVIGPDGTIAYAFRGEGPDDRPGVDVLVAAVRDLDR